MKKLLIILLIIPAMASAQPVPVHRDRTIKQPDTLRYQVKIDSVLELKKAKATIRGVDKNGDIIILKYGWHKGPLGLKLTKEYFMDRWFTVEYVRNKTKNGYRLARIFPNQ